ncbi:aminopeptidase, partial [Mycena olivaceomarginata]
LFPEWESTSAFIATHVMCAMKLDTKWSSHPIESLEFIGPCRMDQIFNGLSYSKAASVLYMLSEYIAEKQFLEGTTLYLKKHLYGNTVTHDLWDGISAASGGKDIVHLMNNWITKIGFPLITVRETSTGIHVCQDRYLDNRTPTVDENETIWFEPQF